MWSELIYRLRAIFRRKTVEREMEDELQFHVERQTAKYAKSGLLQDEATRRARLDLGGLELVREECREARGIGLVDASIQDFRYAANMLRRNVGFTLIAGLTLALGIGATTAIFGVVDAVLLRPLPFADPDRLVMVWEDATYVGFPQNTPAPANFIDWRKRNAVFTDMGALAQVPLNLTGDGEPERFDGYRVTWNVFSILGVKPALGRTFLEQEDQPGGAKAAVISDGLWKRRFGGDPGIVGADIYLNNQKVQVVGVMPPGFHFPERATDIWVPAAYTEQQWARREVHFLNVIARLKPGVRLEQAAANMDVIAKQLADTYPSNKSLGAKVVPFKEQFAGSVRQGLVVQLVAVSLLLLIACANVANLLLARTSNRTREIAVRNALGAGRFRIARQMFAENLLLAFGGSLLGVALAASSLGFLQQFVPADLQLSVPLRIDLRVLSFAFFAMIFTTLLFGFTPVLQACRFDFSDALKTGLRSHFGGRNGLRSFLIVSEVALSLILLIAASLLIRSFANLRGVDPGFRSADVLTLRIVLPASKYPDAEKRAAFFDEAVDKLRSLPGAKEVAFTSALPLVWKGGSNSFEVEGRAQPHDNLPYDANDRVVSPNYMQVMAMRITAGRYFEASDGSEGQPVAIINETMARMYFPGENAVGKRIRFSGDGSQWCEVVGIVKDVRQMGLDVAPRPEMYFPYRQAFYNWMAPRDIVIRADDPMAIAAAARQRIWEVDRNQPVSNIATLDEILDTEVQQRRVQAVLLGAFSSLALMLACVGLYGVLSFLVAQRTSEIGVRIALGANRSDIMSNVLGRGFGLGAIGIAIGLVAAFALTRLLESMLFGIKARDPLTFVAAAAITLLVASAASIFPAWRAMLIDPMKALRNE